MLQKWGKSIADDLKEAKMNDPVLRETEVRKHPDLPDREDCTHAMSNDPCMYSS